MIHGDDTCDDTDDDLDVTRMIHIDDTRRYIDEYDETISQFTCIFLRMMML